MLGASDRVEHFFYGAVQADEYGAADDAVPDVELLDAVNGSHVTDVSVIESVSGVHAEPVFAGEDGHVLKRGEFAVHVRGRSHVAGSGEAPGVKLGEVGAYFARGLDLFRFRVDEHAHGDVVVLERRNVLGESVGLGGYVESAFGGDFLAVLGDERHHVRLHVDRELEHFLRRRHFHIEVRRHHSAEEADVAFLDVALVFAEVRRDAVAAGELGEEGRGHRIRFTDFACFADGRDMIDVHTEFDRHRLSLFARGDDVRKGNDFRAVRGGASFEPLDGIEHFVRKRENHYCRAVAYRGAHSVADVLVDGGVCRGIGIDALAGDRIIFAGVRDARVPVLRQVEEPEVRVFKIFEQGVEKAFVFHGALSYARRDTYRRRHPFPGLVYDIVDFLFGEMDEDRLVLGEILALQRVPFHRKPDDEFLVIELTDSLEHRVRHPERCDKKRKRIGQLRKRAQLFQRERVRGKGDRELGRAVEERVRNPELYPHRVSLGSYKVEIRGAFRALREFFHPQDLSVIFFQVPLRAEQIVG